MRYASGMRTASMAIIVILAACNQPEPGPTTPTSASPDPVATATTSSSTKTAAHPAPASGLVGTLAPDFELTGLDGAKAKLSEHKGKVVVLEWFNPDCPFVKNAHGIGSLKGLEKKVKELYGDELVWLAINSGGEGRQGHGDEANRAGKAKFGIDYPVLYDADGSVGAKYGATNTPHMYIIDKDGKVAYAGDLDNTGSGDPEDASPVVNYVTDALEDLKAARPVRTPQTKAWGCTVKYANK